MVNFHALRQAAKAYGGYGLHSGHREGFKVAAYFYGSHASSADDDVSGTGSGSGSGGAQAGRTSASGGSGGVSYKGQAHSALSPVSCAFPIPIATPLPSASAATGTAPASALHPDLPSKTTGGATTSAPTLPASAEAEQTSSFSSSPCAQGTCLAYTSGGFCPHEDAIELDTARYGDIYAHRPFPRARWAVMDHLLRFTPEDLATLQRNVRDEYHAHAAVGKQAAPGSKEPSLRLVLALLRLCNHDSDVYVKFKGAIIDRLAAMAPSPGPGGASLASASALASGDPVKADIRSDVDRVYASYYPLSKGRDVCFELGRTLMGLQDFRSALEFFQRSNELCGEHHVTWHNAGMCWYFLGDFEASLNCFKHSLLLKDDYAEARLWWEKASLQVQNTTGNTQAAAGSGVVQSGRGAVPASASDEWDEYDEEEAGDGAGQGDSEEEVAIPQAAATRSVERGGIPVRGFASDVAE